MTKKYLSLVFVFAAVLISACTPTPNPHFKVGKPYVIDGQQYVPGIDPKYTEIGIASWYGYGDGFHNELTANGELFDRNLMTAAHKTLPLPSVVKVTNLENGRVATLRVNDRGPFVKGRIIDVSKEAAKRLGFKDKGKAKVLVELDKAMSLKAADTVKIKPEDKEILAASYSGPYVNNNKIATRKMIKNNVQEIKKYYNTVEDANAKTSIRETQVVIKEPKSLQYAKIKNSISKPYSSQETNQSEPIILEKTIEQKTIIQPSDSSLSSFGGGNNYFVQIASFSDADNASELQRKLNSKSTSVEQKLINGKQYYRVRLGGYKTKREAEIELMNIKKEGYSDAFIVAEN